VLSFSQHLYDGKTMTVKQVHPDTGELVNIVMTMEVLLPVDMSCHWSIFQAGGGAGGLGACPCHRCRVTKELLGKAFQRYEVFDGETLEAVSLRLGFMKDFLREINPPLGSPMDLVYRKFQLPLPARPAATTKEAPATQVRGRGRGRRRERNQANQPPGPEPEEWAPTIALDRDSLPRDDEPIGKG
jgi:hypothetical protein